MSLRDFAYIVAVADHRHFGRAAEACNVSQPTLSGQLRKLEERLGVTLFERNSRNVALTPVGESVVAEARAALAHAEALRDVARSHRDPLAGPLRLGIIASLAPYLAPELLMAVEHDAPRMKLALVENLTDHLLAALRARDLDAVLAASAPGGDDLVEIPLFDEPFLIGHAPDHPFAAKPSLNAVDLERTPLLLLVEGHCLRNQALSLCSADTVDRSISASSLLTVMRLAASGRGATFVPALAAPWAEGLTLRPFGNGAARRRVRLIARRHYPRQGALEVVAAAARSIAAASGLGLASPDAAPPTDAGDATVGLRA